MPRFRYSLAQIAQFVGIGLIAVAVAWWWLSPKRGDLPYIAACRPLYHAAQTHADTVRIDGLRPLQQDEPRVEQPTCGTVRLDHPDQFTAEAGR